MKKITIPIKGMHCRSCEISIEQGLTEISGVKKAEVSHRKNVAEVYFSSEKIDTDKIERIVRNAGYEVGRADKKTFLTKNNQDYKDIGIALLFLLGIYLILRNIGITSLNLSPVSSSFSLPVVLLVGLTAGFSTCMALVGGLILGISARHAELHPEATKMQNFRPHLFFNAGRISGYAFLGGVLGIVGSAIQFSGLFLGAMTIGVGIVMLILGLKLTGIFPWMENINFTLPKSVNKIFGIRSHEKEYSHKGSMIAGALTFFLPCGFTQSMQLLAVSSGSFFQGFLIMGIFAVGTAPGLLGVGGITSLVKGVFAKRFFKFAGIVVIAMAMFNISNGYKLFSISFVSSNVFSKEVSRPAITASNSDVQVIKMIENSRGYTPDTLTVKKGIPVRWEIDAKDQYSCASSFIVPKLGVKKNLTKGLNVIEFTPTESGVIPFSCSMGMYRGTIVVVDDVTKTPVAEVNSSSQEELEAEEDFIPASGSCH